MRILLAIDDSECSREAIRSVSRQFRPKGTDLRVLHVVEPIAAYISAEMIPHFVPHVANVEEDRRKQALALVQRAAWQLRKAGFKTSEMVDEGDPKSKIIDQAAKWNAGLIVVGSHGWRGLNRFLLGSVSESVVRHAGCSVEIVRIRGAAKRSKQKRAKHAG
jgi:nucleotide-binding universal stress UspA family protein